MAAHNVFITVPAAHDLQGIADYIANSLREPITAKRQLGRIKETVLSLADFPTRYAFVADETLAKKGYRMVAVDNYLVFYIVSGAEETVTVIRVLYNRRDWAPLL